MLRYADTDGCVYALDPYGLNQSTGLGPGTLQPRNSTGGGLPFIADAFNLSDDDFDGVVAAEPTQVDHRMMHQLAAFTIRGSARSLMTLSHTDDFLFKFEVPAKKKEYLQVELDHLGIRESVLFPDLQHLGEEQNQRRFRPFTPGGPNLLGSTSAGRDDSLNTSAST